MRVAQLPGGWTTQPANQLTKAGCGWMSQSNQL
jgi:hypothetical protein